MNTKMVVITAAKNEPDHFDNAHTLEEFIEQLGRLKPGDTVDLYADPVLSPERVAFGLVKKFVVKGGPNLFQDLYNATIQTAGPLLSKEHQDIVNAKISEVLAAHDCSLASVEDVPHVYSLVDGSKG